MIQMYLPFEEFSYISLKKCPLENCNFRYYILVYRPIAGHANFCPNSISTKPQELEILLSTVKHEILHALGFSISLFAFYRDSDGNPLTPREENGKPAQNHRFVLIF